MRKSIKPMLVVAVATLATMVVFTSNVGAAEPDGAYTSGEVTTTTTAPGPDESIILSETDERATVAGKTEQAANVDKLPFTGTDSVLLAGIGVVAIAIGGSVLLLRRRVAS